MTAVPTNATFEAVQAIQRAPSVGKIKDVLRRVADHRGYEFFHCSAPPPVGADLTARNVLFEEWPAEWKRRYTDERLYMIDPVVVKLQCSSDPFLWSSVRTSRTTRAEIRVMDDAASYGLREGLIVPIFGIGGSIYGAAFAGFKPRCDSIARAELHLVSMYAYARAKQLRRREPEPPVAISLKEREALQWAAAGKSDWEIGEVIGITEGAAHKRIESAKRKYGVATRMQAVVEALRRGHIQI